MRERESNILLILDKTHRKSYNRYLMMAFILLRILDVVTTLLNINKWGIGVEGNPLMRGVMGEGLFIPYQVLMTGTIIIVAESLLKYRRIIYVGLSVLSLFIAVNNLCCYLLIK